MGPSAPTATSLLTVKQAADLLGVSRWDVMRLVKAGAVQAVVLIEAASIEAMKENL